MQTVANELIIILFTAKRLAQKQKAKQRIEEEEKRYSGAHDIPEEERLQK
jgi:hypothetical protein